MSNRLTNDMRDKIAYNAIKHRFAAPIADLRKRRATLAERVYEDIFRRCRDQMYALPDGWLPEANHVEVKLGATHTQLNFNGDFRGYYNSKASEIVRYCGALDAIEKRFPAKNARRCSGIYDASHDFSIEYDRLSNEKADLNEALGLPVEEDEEDGA